MMNGPRELSYEQKRWLEAINDKKSGDPWITLGGCLITIALLASICGLSAAILGDLDLHSYSLLYVGLPASVAFCIGFHLVGKAHDYKGTILITQSLGLAILFGGLALAAQDFLNDDIAKMILGYTSLLFLVRGIGKMLYDAVHFIYQHNSKNK